VKNNLVLNTSQTTKCPGYFFSSKHLCDLLIYTACTIKKFKGKILNVTAQKKMRLGAGRVVQVVKCLPGKHEALNSNHCTAKINKQKKTKAREVK
jgi:hypothetical protein